MTSALIIVDAQLDFIFGSLGAPGREKIIPNIVKWAEKVDVVIASRDWHPLDHCSFESMGGRWPRHCVQNTQGSRLADRVSGVADVIVDKGMDPSVEAYDVFDGVVRFGKIPLPVNMLSDVLGIDEFIVCGYCTDYCVKATALTLARTRAVHPRLAVDAIAGVGPVDSAHAVNEMLWAGVKLVSLDG